MAHPMMWRMMSSDPDAVKGQKLNKSLVRRVGTYARPYRGMLIAFLVTIVAEALLGLAPPLLFRKIIDNALPHKNQGLLVWLGVGVVTASVTSSVLGIAERIFSSRVGEGLIFDLRTQLFDHVQRLPISFFTRTQTGALVSRLNNDVIGAQRAFTGTLSGVVSNVIALVLTAGVMFSL